LREAFGPNAAHGRQGRDERVGWRPVRHEIAYRVQSPRSKVQSFETDLTAFSNGSQSATLDVFSAPTTICVGARPSGRFAVRDFLKVILFEIRLLSGTYFGL
jgi:hypothetical protein